MDNETIKQLALNCGFTLKDTNDNGEPDLKPYVYEFAQAVALIAKADLIDDVLLFANSKGRQYSMELLKMKIKKGPTVNRED